MKRLVVMTPLAVCAGAAAEEPRPEPRPTSVFSRDYARMAWTDAQGTAAAPGGWDGEDWVAVGGVATGTAVMLAFDKPMAHWIQKHRSKTGDDLSGHWQQLGAGGAFVALGGFMAAGEGFGDARAQSVVQDAIPAMLMTGGLVTACKYTIGRERPNENTNNSLDFDLFKGYASFPSGHTSNAFALATAIACNYDETWVKAAAYTAATGVGVSRMYQNQHYASDVFVGAAIGTFIGYTVHKINGPARGASGAPAAGSGPITRWEPWYDGRSRGVAVTHRF